MPTSQYIHSFPNSTEFTTIVGIENSIKLYDVSENIDNTKTSQQIGFNLLYNGSTLSEYYVHPSKNISNNL